MEGVLKDLPPCRPPRRGCLVYLFVFPCCVLTIVRSGPRTVRTDAPHARALGLRRLPTLVAGVAGVLLRPSAFDPSAAGSAESLSSFITKFQSHCGHRFAQAGFRGAGGAVWAVLSLPGLLSVRSLHTRPPCGTSTRWQFCRLEIARFPLPRPQSATRRQKHHHLLFSLNSVQLLKQQRIQGAPRSGVSKHFL